MNSTPDSAADFVFYQVDLKINSDVILDFDDWLKDHVQAMLSLPGFLSASVDIPDKTITFYQYRTVKFRLNTKEDLDNYFDNHAERMRAEVDKRFKSSYSAKRKVFVIPRDQANKAYSQKSG